MKTQKAFKNVISAIFFQVLLALTQFFVTKYYIEFLGVEINGINNLYIQILNYFNLIEAGIGGVFLFNLYRTFTTGDEETTKALIYTAAVKFKKYAIVFIIITGLFSFLIPFVFESVQVFSKYFIYASFWVMISITSLSYFFSVPLLVFHADQKGYVVNIIKNGLKLTDCITRIILLFYIQDYLVLLLCTFVFELSYYVIIYFLFKKRYKGYITNSKEYYKPELFKENKHVLIDKFLVLIVFQTDVIVLALFKDLTTVTLYTNYVLVFSFAILFFSSIFKQITPSLGALINEGRIEKIKLIYNEIYSFSWFLSSIIAVVLFFTFDDVVLFWLGDQFILDKKILILLIFNFIYVSTVQASTAFVNAKGDFKKRIFGSVLECTVNIFISLMLVEDYGILGVMIGTTIGHFSSNFWWIPKICFSYFNRSLKDYFQSFSVHLFVLFVIFTLNFIFFEFYPFKINTIIELLYFIFILSVANFVIFLITYQLFFNHFRQFNIRITNFLKSKKK